MGKAARLRQQRQATPPPVGKKAGLDQNRKTVAIATAGLVAAAGIIVVILLVTRSSPSVPKAAPETASDKSASAALVAAANAVKFHPTTEPGTGQIEPEPASDAPSPSNPNLLPVGSVAPAFTLETPQGRKVSLSDYRDKTVLLEFFATWCPHCNAEAPHLRQIARSYAANKKVAFLSINADGETAPSVYAFHRYYGLPYPALVDSSSQPGSFNRPGAAGPVTTKYAIEYFPTFYLIGPTGKILWRSDGEQPDAFLRQQLTHAS